jgi:hypothetical protein
MRLSLKGRSMLRRHLLTITAFTPVVVMIAACGAALTPAQIVTQAAAVATGLQGAIKQVVAAYPALIPAGTAATIQTDLTDASAAATSLSASLPAATGASIVQTVEGYINAVLSVLAGPPINGLIPAPFNMAIAAAAVLIPQLEAFANTYLPTTAAAAPVTIAARQRFAALAPTMTPDAAVAILATFR